MKPTAKEITAARKLIVEPTTDDAEALLSDWEGQGWHPTELLYGILIGMQIAKSRNEKKETARSKAKLLRLYQKEFSGIPVYDMINRGWLGDVEHGDIPAIEVAVLKFFKVSNEDELWELLSKPIEAQLCRIGAR